MKAYRYAALALSLALLGACAQAKPRPRLKRQDYSVQPAPDQEAIILNMAQALSIAMHENLTVLTAEQNVESAKGRSKAASSALGPYLSLQGQGNAYDKVPN
ncbi:MAG: TolC family protein, partial [Pyramidobacter sp.]|nr:TolC family protein [Pyramidobacter sp.]